ncbi:hypothetical protein TMatcc_005582 [Talaromyces marneffei ATCC 18224]
MVIFRIVITTVSRMTYAGITTGTSTFAHKHLVNNLNTLNNCIMDKTKPSGKRIRKQLSNCRESDISPGHSCPEKEHGGRGYGGVTRRMTTA